MKNRPSSAAPAPHLTIRWSKLEPPFVAGPFVRRPLIETRLDRALTRPLTIITAPAGHGKTRSIIEWLQVQEFDFAWITIDSRDANITRFASHVAVALDTLAPGLVPELFDLLRIPDRLPPGELGEAFGDALYDLNRDVVLVLDDVHAAGSSTVSAFVMGLVSAGPRRLHTILSSRRRLPVALSRLRATGELEELTGADLRFSEEETTTLLRLELGGVIAPELAARISAAVGGWPAAVRLLALALRSGHERLAMAPMPSPSQEQLILDYLGEEVLPHLPPFQQGLLLRTSLVEQFTVPLMAALADGDGVATISQAQVEELRALDLFREVPGLSETWYEFHPLFRDIFQRYLARSLGTEAVTETHRRAAVWLAHKGLNRQAIHHLVEAGDIASASTLIESDVNDAFGREDWRSVSSWLRQIPIEETRRRPELLLASAWVAYLSGRGGGLPAALNALRVLRDQGALTEAQRAEMDLVAISGFIAIERDPPGSVAIAEHAITHIPPSKRYRYGYAHMVLAVALDAAGREEEALARLTTFADHESAQIDAASIRGYFGRVLVLWQSGALTLCRQTAADLRQLASMNGLPISAGWGTLFLGFVAHERGDLDEAITHFSAVIADADRLHYICAREAFFGQILAYEIRGLLREADRAVARLREFVVASEAADQITMVDSFVARTALIRGDIAAAERWLSSSSPTLDSNQMLPLEHPLLTRIKVLIAVGTPELLAEAERLLASFVNRARGANSMLTLLEALAVSALLHEARGAQATAVHDLRQSLLIAEPEGIVQRFVYLGSPLVSILRRLLLESDPPPNASSVLTTLEAMLSTRQEAILALQTVTLPAAMTLLSAREGDVLQALAKNLTNSEIGDALFISPMTVKHHVAHICAKLNVIGRRAAVARARELGILT